MSKFRHPHLVRGILHTPVGAFEVRRGVADRIARHDPAVARYDALLILNDSKLVGIVTRDAILRVIQTRSELGGALSSR